MCALACKCVQPNYLQIVKCWKDKKVMRMRKADGGQHFLLSFMQPHSIISSARSSPARRFIQWLSTRGCGCRSHDVHAMAASIVKLLQLHKTIDLRLPTARGRMWHRKDGRKVEVDMECKRSSMFGRVDMKSEQRVQMLLLGNRVLVW